MDEDEGFSVVFAVVHCPTFTPPQDRAGNIWKRTRIDAETRRERWCYARTRKYIEKPTRNLRLKASAKERIGNEQQGGSEKRARKRMGNSNIPELELAWGRKVFRAHERMHRPLQKRERTGKEYGCFPFV